ncbi:MAG: HEPN domain-containing protein [Candidatus Methanofastidiosia archaeon]
MNVIYNLSESKDAKSLLKIDPDFSVYDWVIISGYYSMYHAVLACLARFGYKSDNHTATMFALEYFFVNKGLLEKEYLEMLKKVRNLEKQYIKMVWRVKERRETAQSL